MYTELATEAVAIAADGIHSASQSTSEKLTAAVDLAKYEQVLFILDAGTLGASATLDFQVKGSTTSGGTYTAISGSAITPFAAGSQDDRYARVLVSAEALLSLGYRYIKGSLVPGTAASQASVIVLGFLPRFKPVASDATLVQDVNVWVGN